MGINEDVQLFSDFDSGNMARYERVQIQTTTSDFLTDNIQTNGDNGQKLAETTTINTHTLPKYDLEFNLWTRRDCENSLKVNSNRSWFYFGIKGGHGKCIRFNVMNLNRQARLFEMGMLPVFRTVPGHEKWSRLYTRPIWETQNDDFKMSFIHRIVDMKTSVTYFAFCFPYSYEETQELLDMYDTQYGSTLVDKYLHPTNPKSTTANSDIYYHRETLCYSIDGNKIDLLTITSYKGIQHEREHHFDKKLFPQIHQRLRPHQFKNKRIFFLSSRVHPGETPASFVFLGFLEFILKQDDLRAKLLRDLYIFKLIPILNPDGVKRGHYRTDQLGQNLNRMYLDPDFDKHPSIYASKSLLIYHHINNQIEHNNSNSASKLTVYDVFQNVMPHEEMKRRKEEVIITMMTAQLSTPSMNRQISIESIGSIPEVSEKPTSPVVRTPQQRYTKLKSSVTDGIEYLQTATTAMGYEQTNEWKTLGQPLIATNRSKSKTSHFRKEIIYNHDVLDTTTSTASDIMARSPRKNSDRVTHDMPFFLQKKQELEIMNQIDSTDIDAQNFFLDRRETHIHIKENTDEVNKSAPYSFHFTNENLEFHQDMYRNLTVEDEECYHIGNEGSDDEDEYLTASEQKHDSVPTTTVIEAKSPHLSNVDLLKISPYESGIRYYIDLHGHASKKGCFVYGNYLQDDDMHTDNLLFAKLISLNSPHFDYDNCNFTIKNMYMRDKREGLSKEGSGRVALYKHLGILHSYTLECSYAVGKTCQSLPAAENEHFGGRVSPAYPYSLPQKLTQEHYKDVGKACALAALDILPGQNPFTRVTQSTFRTLQALKDYLKHQVRIQRNRTNRTSVAPPPTNSNVTNSKGKQQLHYASKIHNYNNKPTNLNNNTQSTTPTSPSLPSQTMCAPSSTSMTKAANRFISSNLKFRSNSRRNINNKQNYPAQIESNPSDTFPQSLSRLEISSRTPSSLKLVHSSSARLREQQLNQMKFNQTIPISIIDPVLISRHNLLRFAANKLPMPKKIQREEFNLSSLPVSPLDIHYCHTRMGQSAPQNLIKRTLAHTLKQQPQEHHQLPLPTDHLVPMKATFLTYKQDNIQNSPRALFE